MQKKPESLTFDRFREIISPHAVSVPDTLYLTRDISVVINANSMVQRVMKSNLILQVQDYRCDIVKRGKAKLWLNLIEREFHTGMMVFLTPGTILQPIAASDDFSLTGMALSSDMVHLSTGGRLPLYLDGRQMDGQLEIDADEMKLLTDMYALLMRIVQYKNPNKQATLSMVAVILSEFDQMFASQDEYQQSNSNHEQSMFDRFIYLVNKFSRQQHQMAFYAEKMCISERYLGSVVKQASGVTAKEWIDRSLISAAKVLLKHSELSSSQIADELSFPNPSFFTKYFKRLVGCTPQEFRKD